MPVAAPAAPLAVVDVETTNMGASANLAAATTVDSLMLALGLE